MTKEKHGICITKFNKRSQLIVNGDWKEEEA